MQNPVRLIIMVDKPRPLPGLSAGRLGILHLRPFAMFCQKLIHRRAGRADVRSCPPVHFRRRAGFPSLPLRLALAALITLFAAYPCRAVPLPQSDASDDAAARDNLRRERQKLKSVSEESWKNRDLDAAIRQTERLAAIEGQLFGADAELLVERFRRLCELQLEAGRNRAAEKYRDKVVRLLLANAQAESWHHFAANAFANYVATLQAMDADRRVRLFDDQRHLHQSVDQSDHAAALAAAESVAAVVSAEFGNRDLAWVDALFNVAYLQVALGQLDTAEIQLQQLHNRMDQFVPTDHYNFAILYWLKGYLRVSQGDAPAAARESKAAIAQFEQSGATWHPLYAQALRLKAYVDLVTGQHDQAISPLRKAYRLSSGASLSRETQDDSICSDLCTALQVAAALRMEERDAGRAKQLCDEAYHLATDRWGKTDYRVVNIRHQRSVCLLAEDWSPVQFEQYEGLVKQENAAESMLQQNNLSGSFDAAKTAFEGFQRLLSPDHPRVLLNRKRLLSAALHPGVVSQDQKDDFKQTVLEFATALTDEFGPDHPTVADLWYRLSAFVDADDPDRLSFARRAVRAYRNSLSVESEQYVTALTRLGRWLCDDENPDAEAVLQEAVQLWKSRPSRGSYQHGVAAYWLGYFYYYVADQPYSAAGRIRDAVRIFRQVPEQTAGLEPALALNLLGNVYSDRESYDEALVHYRDALELFEQHQPIERSGEEGTYRWLLYNTARSCFEKQLFKEAESLLLRLLERFPDGPNSRRMSYLYGCLALTRVYAAQKEFESAESTLAQAGFTIDLHFRSQDDFDSRKYRAWFAVHAARLALAKQDPQAARPHMDLAWAEYQALAAAPEQLSAFDIELLTVSIDRLIELYEQIDAWQQIVRIRRVLVPLCRVSLAEDWPHLFQIEEARLQDATRLAAADHSVQVAFRKLREQTTRLRDFNKQNQGHAENLELVETDEWRQWVQKLPAGVSLPPAEHAQQLATYFARREQFERATELQREAMQAYFETLGVDHPLTADAQVALAGTLRKTGRYAEARQLLTLAVQSLTDVQGEYNVDTILARLELAQLYADIEDFAAALPLAREAADSFGNVWGTQNVTYAEALEALGVIYLGLNELPLAEQQIRNASQIYEQLLPEADPRRLRGQSYLAVIMAVTDASVEDTEAAFRKSILAYEQAEATQRTDFTRLLSRYGDFLRDQNKYAAAAESYQRALDSVVQQQNRKSTDALRAMLLVRSATVRRQTADPAAALDQLRDALAIQQQMYGSNAPVVSETLHQMALCHYRLQNRAAARRCVLESLEIQQEELLQVGNLLSERSLQVMLGGSERRLDLLLHLLQIDGANEHLDPATGFHWTLQRKGLAMDLACRVRAVQQASLFDSRAVRMGEQLRLLNQELADLALRRSDGMTPEQLQAERERLTSEIAALNSRLSLQLAAGRSAPASASNRVADVQAVLADGTVFVEYVRVTVAGDQDAAESQDASKSHYAAFVVTGNPQPAVEFHDLGPANEIDDLIGELRDLTRRVPRLLRLSTEEQLETDYRQVARRLFDHLLGFLNVAEAAPDTIIIGPDAQLSTLPFSALVTPADRFLVEDVNISYVSSARDLLRDRAEPGRGTIILSNPNFDADRQLIEQSLQDLQTVSGSEAVIAMRGAAGSTAASVDLRSLRWRPLPGAEREAADVEEILSESGYAPVSTYVGNQAVEEVLKAVRTPRIVHLATHGFYLPLQERDGFSGQTRSSWSLGSGLSRLRSDRNPLLRSGLVLAGANRISQPLDAGLPPAADGAGRVPEDGWVTAQEIAGMNFRHTQLVVLSACESGLGDFSAGQGVQGLRRAFLHAGAHAVLTSLFEVPDQETRKLMKSFYQHLHQTDDRRAALNEAQRQRIQERRAAHGAAHPFFWASFIMLDGAETRSLKPVDSASLQKP